MKWCMQNVWPEKSKKVGLIDEVSFKVHMTRNFFFLFLVVGYL